MFAAILLLLALLPTLCARKPPTAVSTVLACFTPKRSQIEVHVIMVVLVDAVDAGAETGVGITYTGGTACSSGTKRSTYVDISCDTAADPGYAYLAEEGTCNYYVCVFFPSLATRFSYVFFFKVIFTPLLVVTLLHLQAVVAALELMLVGSS